MKNKNNSDTLGVLGLTVLFKNQPVGVATGSQTCIHPATGAQADLIRIGSAWWVVVGGVYRVEKSNE